LLLPYWCRIHKNSHFGFECLLCQKIVEKVKEKFSYETTNEKLDVIERSSIGEEISKSESELVIEGKVCVGQYKEIQSTKFWTLRFDGSRSKQGARDGFELNNPMGKIFLATHWLQFYFTNNVVEYDALVHRFLLALHKNLNLLQV
jgi:hypothetical protein